MDVLNDQVIDIGLKVVGYLAAAGLGMLIYSALTERRRATTSVVGASETATQSPHPTTAGHNGMQFVDLRNSLNSSATNRTALPLGTRDLKADKLRDRPEIIRLARQMLKAGTPADRVRRTLPITDAELALLQSANPH